MGISQSLLLRVPVGGDTLLQNQLSADSYIEILYNRAKLQICSKFPPNLVDSPRMITCHYVKFRHNSYMLSVSQRIKVIRVLRYIAAIFMRA